jgi:hypothetical protein
MAICLGGLGVKAHHTFLRIHQLEPYSNFYFQAIGTKIICYVMTGNVSKTQKPERVRIKQKTQEQTGIIAHKPFYFSKPWR